MHSELESAYKIFKIFFLDLHRLCQAELKTVTKFLQNKNNKPPEEFDGYNDTIHLPVVREAQMYLEKDLNILNFKAAY